LGSFQKNHRMLGDFLTDDTYCHLAEQVLLEEQKSLSSDSAPSSQAEGKPPEIDVTRYTIRLIAEGVGEAEGELIRFQSPMTVDNLAKTLPFEGRAARWKEEIYFETPVKLGSEKAKSKVEVGALAYWPMGSALCVFYGPTQPYSPVNIVGKVTSNLELFRTLKTGTKIRVEKI
jgi:hypothetical protein